MTRRDEETSVTSQPEPDPHGAAIAAPDTVEQAAATPNDPQPYAELGLLADE